MKTGALVSYQALDEFILSHPDNGCGKLGCHSVLQCSAPLSECPLTAQRKLTKTKRHPEERRKEIIRQYMDGMALTEIARKQELSYRTIMRILEQWRKK